MPGIGFTPAVPPPQGGTIGQVLVKNTTTNYDVSWQPQPSTAFAPIYVSGSWYSTCVNSGAMLNGGPCTISGIFYIPFRVGKSVTISSLAIGQQTSSTVTFSMAVLTANGAMPGTLLAAPQSVTGNTYANYSVSYSATIPVGLNYFAVQSSVSAPVTALGYEGQGPSPYPNGSLTTPSGVTVYVSYLLYSGSTIISNPTTTYATTVNPPLVMFKVA